MIDAKNAPYGVMLLRVSMGILFILHGVYLKVFVFGMAGAGKFFTTLGLPDWFAWVVMLYETIGDWRSFSASTHDGSRPSLEFTCYLPRTWAMLQTVGISPIKAAATNSPCSGQSRASHPRSSCNRTTSARGRSPRRLRPRGSSKSPMPQIEQRLAALGLVLPERIKPPPGVALRFQFVRIVGNRGYISGHGPQNADGSIAEPLGKLGRDLTIEQGYAAARLTALCILGRPGDSQPGRLGPCDAMDPRVWHGELRPIVINGFSDLILELWGAQAGAHSRSAVGMADSLRHTGGDRGRG